MRKSIILLIFTLGSSLFTMCGAQDWDSVGSGITGTNAGSVNAMAVYNGELYAGGNFGKAGDVFADRIAVWNGTTWDSVGGGIGEGLLSSVYSMAVYKGNLYAAGAFGYAEEKPGYYSIAEWNGTSWLPLGGGITGGSGSKVLALAVYNNKLIVGGEFGFAGGIPAPNIASWDGTAWDTLGPGLPSTFGVGALAVYDSVLYAGGDFDSTGPDYNIAQWNGTTWSALGSGLNSYVYSMAVYSGSLYVGGVFDTAGGKAIAGLATWNGSTWNPVGGNNDPLNGTPYYMMAANGILYVGGDFSAVSGITANAVAIWNGTKWDSVGRGFAKDSGVTCMALYNSELYAGGGFTLSGSTKANHIARWPYPTGINSIGKNAVTISIFPNPSTGLFTLSLSNVNEKCNIEIYNEIGQKVMFATLKYLRGDNLIDLSKQPNGVYFYRVISKAGLEIGSGKLIIDK